MGRDNAVGIATRYLLDGPGIEVRWRKDPPTPPSRLALGSTQLIYNGYQVIPGVKRSESGFDHSAPLAPRFKKVYSYSPSEPLYGLF